MEIDCDTFTLRPLELRDKESLAKNANNRLIWLNLLNYFPHPYTENDAESFIDFCKKQSPKTTFCIDVNNECAGIIGFKPQHDVYCKTAEIGYWLGESHWGKGIMTKATQQFVQYIFNTFDIARIHAGVFGWNKASMKVLEKSGFKHEGVFEKAIFKDGRFADEYRYSLLKK